MTFRMIWKFLFLIFNIIHLSYGYFGRDWALWKKAQNIVQHHIDTKEAIGLTTNHALKKFDIYTHGLKVSVDNSYRVVNQDLYADSNIITGRGIILKPVNNQIILQIQMPLREVNTCGLVIMSTTEYGCQQIQNVTLYWKNDEGSDYGFVTRPDTGSKTYDLKLTPGKNESVIFFDLLPVRFFALKIDVHLASNINFRVASINKCQFSGKHFIKNCGEKMENNIRFNNLPYGKPIQIKCPLDCLRTWPCWGFRVYSSDSPICWTATQSMGRWGDGEYMIYKIKKSYYFRQNDDLKKTNQIFCKKTSTSYPAYTFERKYYDFTMEEAKKFISVKKKP